MVPLADVRDDAARLAGDVYLIDPQRFRRHRFVSSVERSDVFAEDKAHQTFVHANRFGDAGESRFQTFLMDARKQAACHQSLVVYIGERLHEGLAARRALVADVRRGSRHAWRGRANQERFVQACRSGSADLPRRCSNS